MLDVIQIHSDHIGRLGSFDDVDVKRISSAGMGLSGLSQEIRFT